MIAVVPKVLADLVWTTGTWGSVNSPSVSAGSAEQLRNRVNAIAFKVNPAILIVDQSFWSCISNALQLGFPNRKKVTFVYFSVVLSICQNRPLTVRPGLWQYAVRK